jgi:hypothetical protein
MSKNDVIVKRGRFLGVTSRKKESKEFHFAKVDFGGVLEMDFFLNDNQAKILNKVPNDTEIDVCFGIKLSSNDKGMYFKAEAVDFLPVV